MNIDPALHGMIAYLAGLVALTLLMEFVRAFFWCVAFILVLKRFGFVIQAPRARR